MLVVFLFLVLLTRIALLLQIVRHHFYNTLSNQNRIEVIPIEPIRGLIYDRQGILLAKNIPAFSLDIEPSKIDDLSATIDDCAALSLLTKMSSIFSIKSKTKTQI